MGMSDYLEAAILNSLLRNTAFPAEPANVYVELYTVAPTDAGGGTLATGGSYARVAVTTTGGWTAPTTGGMTQNVNAITFPTATASWGSIVAVGIFDAPAGNLLFWGPLATNVGVVTNNVFSFPPGALKVTLD